MTEQEASKVVKSTMAMVALGVVLAIGAFFVNLWTFTKIWALIAVPMGAPSIGMMKAYGFACLFSHFVTPALLRFAEKEKEKDGGFRLVKYSLQTMIGSLMSWGIVSLIFG